MFLGRIALLGFVLLGTPALAQGAHGAQPQREACRAQAREAIGTDPADARRRSGFVRRCMGEAGSADGEARRQACRDEARKLFAPTKATSGRGQLPPRELIRQHVRDCMRRGA